MIKIFLLVIILLLVGVIIVPLLDENRMSYGYLKAGKSSSIISGPIQDNSHFGVTKEERAIEFLKSKKDAFGLKEIPKVRNVDGNNVYFEQQTYGNIPVCSDYPNRIDVSNESFVYLDFNLFLNLTSPTKQKISDKQAINTIRKLYEGKINDDYSMLRRTNFSLIVEPYSGTFSHLNATCISRVWHPDGEYWTYHLTKTYSIYGVAYANATTVADMLYYDVGGNGGILRIRRPTVECQQDSENKIAICPGYLPEVCFTPSNIDFPKVCS